VRRRAPLPTLVVAAALALGSAVSLGLARFAYALLLPTMRADLGWSYFSGGAMNTVNAAGYLVGALIAPPSLRRYGARTVLIVATAATALALAAHGVVAGDAALYALRFVSGAASAPSLVAGAVMAAGLGGAASGVVASGAARRVVPSGLSLGLYYGGTGIGIVAAALLVPALVDGGGAHAWQPAWIGLGAIALVATALLTLATPRPSGAVVGRGRARGRGSLSLAPVRSGAGRVPPVRPRLHRLHDVRDHDAARSAARARP
jgi:MFS family permease